MSYSELAFLLKDLLLMVLTVWIEYSTFSDVPHSEKVIRGWFRVITELPQRPSLQNGIKRAKAIGVLPKQGSTLKKRSRLCDHIYMYINI